MNIENVSKKHINDFLYSNKKDKIYIENNYEIYQSFIENIICSDFDWRYISKEILSELFIEKYADKVDWQCISIYQKLSEEFIEKYSDRLDWSCISIYQKLSESFIEKNVDKVDWSFISVNQKLSEEFIEKYSDKVDWFYISKSQKLSEGFIEKYADKVNWSNISAYQKLSDSFIEKYADRVNWYNISEYQKLTEEFIEKYSDKVYWNYISEYQKLTEEFIEKYADRVDWDYISEYQKLSEQFIDKFATKIHIIISDSWFYKDTEFKKQAVINTGLYECYDDYFIAYKGIRSDRWSRFNFSHQYNKGEIHTDWCNCSADENSFGLSVWDKDNAEDYCSELVVRVKVNYEDVGRVVHDGGKIRCFKIEILD